MGQIDLRNRDTVGRSDIITTMKKQADNHMNSITTEEVLRLASMIRIELSDDEVEKLREQLGETIDYIRNLSELDTSNVEAEMTKTELKNISFRDGAPSPRTFSQEDALANAHKTKDGFFVVPKILDK